MIIHRKIREYLNKFKPGVRFKYNYISDIFIVRTNSHEGYINREPSIITGSYNEWTVYASVVNDAYCRWMPIYGHEPFGENTYQSEIIFMENDKT